MTTASGSIGTAGYQAPEITLGAARPSTQSDVYAMAGVILEVCVDSETHLLAGSSDLFRFAGWLDNEWESAILAAKVCSRRLPCNRLWEKVSALRPPRTS